MNMCAHMHTTMRFTLLHVGCREGAYVYAWIEALFTCIYGVDQMTRQQLERANSE